MTAPGYSLRDDYLLWTLVAAMLVFSLWHPTGVAGYPRLVDWPTLATLAGLLLLTAGIETSGALHHAARRVLEHIHDERRLALFLIGASALLAAILTNDIALFVVVPLTLTLSAYVALPLTRLVIFEALAVNAGSMLTPIGNPQNIFLWQSTGVHFGGFVWAMLPPTLISLVCLFGFAAVAFQPRRVQLHTGTSSMQVDWPRFTVSASLFLPFIACAELRHADMALLGVVGLFLVLYPKVFQRLDWPLLLVFILMFIDLRIIAGLPWVSRLVAEAGLERESHLYFAGIVTSQFISNVPATILLSAHSSDWRSLAWGVDVGGFGLLIGSLANIIALRLGGQRGSLLAFHAWSGPFLMVTGALTGLWLLTHAGG
ncbi:MAG TPA: SLC13 family permease [Rudaea sp.]|nr:SLC13 family permease [Rudaea sp.]